MKVSVKGSQDGSWGLAHSDLAKLGKANYHGAIDQWLQWHGSRTAFCFVQFENAKLDEMPPLYLALHLLGVVYGDVLMGPRVKFEAVDAGRRISAPGVERIEKAIDDGWLQIARLSAKERSMAQSIVSKHRLDGGEAESIALASSRKLIVILDDREARSFAEGLGVQFLGTAGMLFQGFV